MFFFWIWLYILYVSFWSWVIILWVFDEVVRKAYWVSRCSHSQFLHPIPFFLIPTHTGLCAISNHRYMIHVSTTQCNLEMAWPNHQKSSPTYLGTYPTCPAPEIGWNGYLLLSSVKSTDDFQNQSTKHLLSHIHHYWKLSNLGLVQVWFSSCDHQQSSLVETFFDSYLSDSVQYINRLQLISYHLGTYL